MNTIGWSSFQSVSNKPLKFVYFGSVGYSNWQPFDKRTNSEPCVNQVVKLRTNVGYQFWQPMHKHQQPSGWQRLNYQNSVSDHSKTIMGNLVDLMVADDLVPVRHQVISNHQFDKGWITKPCACPLHMDLIAADDLVPVRLQVISNHQFDKGWITQPFACSLHI